MEELKRRFKGLLLNGMAHSLEYRCQYANENKISYLEDIELLVEDQWANRMDNPYRNRLRESQLSEKKTLEQYDFSYQPEQIKRSVKELS